MACAAERQSRAAHAVAAVLRARVSESASLGRLGTRCSAEPRAAHLAVHADGAARVVRLPVHVREETLLERGHGSHAARDADVVPEPRRASLQSVPSALSSVLSSTERGAASAGARHCWAGHAARGAPSPGGSTSRSDGNPQSAQGAPPSAAQLARRGSAPKQRTTRRCHEAHNVQCSCGCARAVSMRPMVVHAPSLQHTAPQAMPSNRLSPFWLKSYPPGGCPGLMWTGPGAILLVVHGPALLCSTLPAVPPPGAASLQSPLPLAAR